MRRLLCIVAVAVVGMGAPAVRAQVAVKIQPRPTVRRAGEVPATLPDIPVAPLRPSADLTPSLITLHYKDASEERVLTDIAAQTGRRFTTVTAPGDSPPSWRLMTVDAEAQPFWTVMNALSDADTRPMAPMELHDDGAVGVRGGYGAIPKIRCVSGAFLVGAVSITHAARFQAAADRQDDCVLKVRVYAEPHIVVRTLKPYCFPDVAVDENGRSLVAPAGAFTAPAPRAGVAWDAPTNAVEVRLLPPPDAGHKIAMVKGTLSLTVAKDIKRVEITDLQAAAPMVFEVGGVSVSVPALRGTAVTVTAKKSGMAATEIDGVVRSAEYHLVDAAGMMVAGTFGGGSGAAGTRTTSVNFATTRVVNGKKFGTPAKLIIEIPTELLEVPVAFEFKDIVLP